MHFSGGGQKTLPRLDIHLIINSDNIREIIFEFNQTPVRSLTSYYVQLINKQRHFRAMFFNLPETAFAPTKADTGSEQDLEFAKKLQAEEYKRYQLLRSQFEQERDAEAKGVLAKKQRVEYKNQSTGVSHPAVVLDVHLDDGPDKPYYTIKYKKPLEDDAGAQSHLVAEVEKQTDPERLKRVVWDEEAAFAAINGNVP